MKNKIRFDCGFQKLIQMLTFKVTSHFCRCPLEKNLYAQLFQKKPKLYIRRKLNKFSI